MRDLLSVLDGKWDDQTRPAALFENHVAGAPADYAPVIVRGLSARSRKVQNGCPELCSLLSVDHPELLAPHLDLFAANLGAKAAVLRWEAVCTRGNLARVEPRVRGAVGAIAANLDHDSIMLANHAVQALRMIAVAFPDEAPGILDALIGAAPCFSGNRVGFVVEAMATFAPWPAPRPRARAFAEALRRFPERGGRAQGEEGHRGAVILLLLACAHHAPPDTVFARWRAAAEARAQGWQHLEQVVEGDSEESWCAPEVSETDCWSGAVTQGEHRGDAWFAVGMRDGHPTWRAGLQPTSGNWGMSLDLDDAGYSLLVVRRQGAAVTRTLGLGGALRWQVELATCDGPPPGELSALVGGPAAFAQAAGGQVRALRAEVGQVRRCSYVRYLGDGSPICDPVPLPAAEAAEAKAESLSERDEIARLVESDATELSALLERLAPPGAR